MNDELFRGLMIWSVWFVVLASISFQFVEWKTHRDRIRSLFLCKSRNWQWGIALEVGKCILYFSLPFFLMWGILLFAVYMIQ